MIRLVQLIHPQQGRRVAIVNEPKLSLLRDCDSVYRLVELALSKQRRLEDIARDCVAAETLDYDAVHSGKSEWRLLPSFDHPDEPARCLVTGTGLTHKKSADNRQAMHVESSLRLEESARSADATAPVSDSMKMYKWGLEGGRPTPGEIGVSPEWFYKGCGTILRAHGEPLEVPAFALDGGDEAEVAGVYVVDSSGMPRRVGLTLANEFSDHVLEQKNYLYLAHSKLRTCAVGPELIVGGDFNDARGTAKILRGGKTLWSKPFATGEQNMSHTVANLEHHHFKYPAHRRAGDAHVYFFGADAFSFGDGVKLEDRDVMEIELNGFGRSLRNSIKIDRTNPKLVAVTSV